MSADPKNPEDAEPGEWAVTYYKVSVPKLPLRYRFLFWWRDHLLARRISKATDVSLREVLRNNEHIRHETAKAIERQFWFGSDA